MQPQVEWVLLCSAFERLLTASANAKDVASRFDASLVPARTIVASSGQRNSDKWGAGKENLRYEWIREFYRIRGDFAHGRLDTRQPTVWSQAEHLFLADLAFPLLVKSRLSEKGNYEMTDEDHAQIDSFEALVGTQDFLRPPPNARSSIDSHWSRLVSEANLKRAYDKGLSSLLEGTMGDSAEPRSGEDG